MKIEALTLHHLRMPLVAPFETSFGRIKDRECILLELQADGEVGFGECVADHDPGYSYETCTTAWHIIRDFLAPILFEDGADSVSEFRKRASRVRGHHFAKAGVEMALWDLLGKHTGQSLRDLLGGVREKVAVGVSIGIQPNPSALVEVAAAYVRNGYGRVKIKIKPGRDVAEAAAVRRAFPVLPLQVDANSAYTLQDAEALLPLEDLDLLLIEQPLSEDDIWDHRSLQRRFRTPICLDESILTARHARYAIEMQACRIINIKPARLGGLSEAVAVHDLCMQHGIPVWCGGMLETGVGRASNLALASLPNFTLPADISASDRYYARDITDERFELGADSSIAVPTGAGLGVHIDRGALEEYRLAESRLEPG
jgi:O-succinylbenzoate synthase